MSATKEKIKVMQHFDNGGKVEWQYPSISESWTVTGSPDWNWEACDYRIKEEPKTKLIFIIHNTVTNEGRLMIGEKGYGRPKLNSGEVIIQTETIEAQE